MNSGATPYTSGRKEAVSLHFRDRLEHSCFGFNNRITESCAYFLNYVAQAGFEPLILLLPPEY